MAGNCSPYSTGPGPGTNPGSLFGSSGSGEGGMYFSQAGGTWGGVHFPGAAGNMNYSPAGDPCDPCSTKSKCTGSWGINPATGEQFWSPSCAVPVIIDPVPL